MVSSYVKSTELEKLCRLLAKPDPCVNPCFVWSTKFREEQYQSLHTAACNRNVLKMRSR